MPIGWASPRSPKQRLAALGLARAAAENSPDNPSLRLTLGEALGGAGMLAEATAALKDACGRFPGHAALHEGLAQALARAGDVEAALALARRWDGSRWAPRFAFKLLTRQGRPGEAAVFETAVAASDPADADLLDCRALRARGNPGALLNIAEAVLAVDAAAMHALYYKAIALAQLGRGEAAAELMGIDRFLKSAVLPSPPGFADGHEFHRTLADEIRGNSSLHADPVGHASRGGLRTGTFPWEGDRAAPAFIDAARHAVSVYSGALSGGHPFVAAKPRRATFNPWALLFPAAGHQRLHSHPGRWLTGVYYVSIPESAGGADALAPGAIRIGGLPEWAGVEPPWPVLTIRPQPGLLILFPSFVPHETVPTFREGERISIAFDVAEF